MSGPRIQGVTVNQEIDRNRLARDTRPILTQSLDFLSSIEATVMIGIGMCICVVMLPFTFDFMPLLALCYAPVVFRNKMAVPHRKRIGLKELDENDLHPGTGKPMLARGIGFIGNRKEDNAEIWDSNEGMRTHYFVLGSTGAGKTEGLTSLAVNALNWGSGFSYVDGKGDVNLWGKVFRMCQQYGRVDDLMVINYMTGNADTTKKRRDKLSNTYNPFTVGNSASLIQLLVSLMDSGDGKGDMWKGRAISFISSLLPALVDLRDNGRLMLHIGAIREVMPFPKYFQLMNDPNISEKNRQMMQAFLFDVPGYKSDKGDNQSGTFNEQFGYQQMQFTRILSSLADTYGHIYYTPQGEVDFNDVVMNRRVLLVLLPALETSRPELANLGKIVVAAMKRMMGSQLGSKLEGSQRDLLDSRATKAPTPFMAIFDEFGYYMPEDAALMWAQARSLGFCLVAAGQDLQAFFRTSREETMAIVANSNMKLFGKIEDPNETYDLILKRAGEAYVTEMGAYELNSESFFGGYRPNREAKHTKMQRIEMKDLVNQVEGEVHILVQSKLIRARLFYAVPDEHKGYEYRVNRFVKVIPPSINAIEALKVDVATILDGLRAEPFAAQAPERWDGAIAEAEAASKGPTAAYYTQQRQGAEIGITLFEAAVAGLGMAKPRAEEGGVGASGGPVHVPPPPTEESNAGAAVVPPPVGVEGNDPDEADESTVQEPASEVPPRVGAVDDVVFDASTVSVFGPSEGVDAGEDDASLFVDAAAALIYSAAGVDRHSVEALSFLNEAQTATALREIAVSLGASSGEAAQIAQGMVDVATTATLYPVPPKPVATEETIAAMDRAMDELRRLNEQQGQMQ